MSDSLAHRGPDDDGVWCDTNAGLALSHRRLSIIDLSESGHQPMLSASGRYAMTFNGEIYNYIELRNQLQQDWRGQSDTEVLLAAFNAWGIEKTLKSIVGMFALALWDREERRLTLARDRLGEKPLYFGWQGEDFLFASELRALKLHPSFLGEVSAHAAAVFLKYNYIPAPYSIYAGIHKLNAGSFVQIDADSISRKTIGEPRRYWSLVSAAVQGIERPFVGTVDEAANQLEGLISQALAGQKIADVPLGAFLSGGIDSSAIVALLAKQGGGRSVRTFSVGVTDSRLNEAPEAREVARILGTDHHELLVTAGDAMGVVDELPRIWDEPFGDSSQIPTLLLCRFAKQHVDVVLSGDGGDEFFLGYDHYRYLDYMWRFRKAVSVACLGAQRRIFNGLQGVTPSSRVRQLVATLSATSANNELEMIGEYRSCYRGEWLSGRMPGEDRYLPEGSGIVREAAVFDGMNYLPDDILVKVDRASMSTSLEARAPLLDHRVVEFAMSLPLSFRLREGESKYLLRTMLSKYLPRHIVARRKKGFSVPVASWLRGGLHRWAYELLVEQVEKREFFEKEKVWKLWQEHQRGFDHSERLWGIVSLCQFLRHQGR